VLGKPVTIGKARGHPLPLEMGGELWVTAHPSYLLRLKDAMKNEQERLFHADLVKVAGRLGKL
jgi:DNA polymerase